MSFRSIRWRVALPYVALILAATLGLTVYVSNQVRAARLADLEAQLLADARLLADTARPLLVAGAGGVIDAEAHHWADLLGARVTIIGADGTVLGESHTDRAQMDNHLGRPEVQGALAQGQGSSIRLSNTLGYEMMYVAVPVTGAGGTGPDLGIARVSLSVSQIQANIGRLRRSILTSGALVAILAAIVALFIAERTAAPIRRLTRQAEQMAEGDLDVRLAPASSSVPRRGQKASRLGYDEIELLAEAMNRMAGQLREKIQGLDEESGRLAGILDHMADGVIITDDQSNVELVNAAALRILNTSEEASLGRSFAAVVPYHQLIELWTRCRERDEEQVEAVEIGHHGLFLQAIITPFEAADAQGYLVILQDLTRIRRLETVRRDFISNISHELRTPLAGLKALVDTLRGGAIKDPPAAKRFLKRMDAEVDALTQMVEELLELSRIESRQAPLDLEPTLAGDLITPAIDRLRPQAERAGLSLHVEVPSGLPLVLADRDRARLVVTNLVHNAIKFTPPGGRVRVSARDAGGEVVISVEDTGVGIPADDLERIFERFFKADRARSGGGTGLGLAIAKHIVQGHGGRIWAESIEGRGSTFHLTLPVAPEGE